MSFAYPKALWLLVLALPIVLAHFYRGRIRRLHVPTLLFWDEVVIEEERASALKRLRHWLTMILALLALALLSTALADPTVRGITPEVREIAIVVDTSPGLGAREADGRTRLELARERARGLAAGLYRRSPVALYDAGGVVEPPTTDRERLEQALARLPREAGDAPLADVVASARAAMPAASIYVFTARPFAPPDANVRVVPAGTPRPNRALRSPAQSGATVGATAVNASDAPADATLVVRDRGRVLAEEPMRLGPRESRVVSKTVGAKDGAFVELALVPEDAFPRDDVAHFVVPPAAPPAVVVVSRGPPDPHLMSALHLMGARLKSIPPAEFAETRDKLGAEPVYVFDRVEAPEIDGGVLAIGAGDAAAEVQGPRILDWDRRTPVNRLVDWSDVVVRRARVLKGMPLVVSDRGPVAVWGRTMGRAWIRFGFGFGVADGDCALRPSFPIFLQGAIAWLADEGRRAFPREARVGDVVVNAAPLPEGASEASVTVVSGGATQTSSVPIDRGEARIAIVHPGLVKIAVGARTEWLAARLESSPDLEKLPREQGVALPEALPRWRDVPYSAVAGALVLLILLVEWWLYQSRG